MKDSDSKLFAFLGVFLSIIGFLIVYLTRKNDKYAMYYAKQGLVLFFAWIIAWIVALILAFIPFIGWIIDVVMWLGLIALWIIGMVYALSDEEKDIPIIGPLARSIKL